MVVPSVTLRSTAITSTYPAQYTRPIINLPLSLGLWYDIYIPWSRYTQEAMRIIADHDPSIPLFSYIAFQNNHEPLEAPDEYLLRGICIRIATICPCFGSNFLYTFPGVGTSKCTRAAGGKIGAGMQP